MKYIVDISYDGSKYYGFQRLNNHLTVQGELEKAIKKVVNEEVLIKGAGRTDRGVHAHHQFCHFETTCNIDPYKFRKAINDCLPNYIYINKCMAAGESFHARFDVKRKTYIYKINLGMFDPIQNDYVYNLNHDLDIERIVKFSKLLLGEHSFKYFVSSVRNNYDTALYDILINRENDILKITFLGKNFYTYMVRNLVGFLIAVGKGKYQEEDINNIFDDNYSGIKYVCVPANGLYLENIEY